MARITQPPPIGGKLYPLHLAISPRWKVHYFSALRLDYGGIDFGRDTAGNILLYEANATMAVFPPPPDEHFAYRRAPVDNVIAAIRQLIVDTAVRGGYVPG